MQQAGWYRAVDGGWYRTSSPPAEGWWIGPDGRWYEPPSEPAAPQRTPGGVANRLPDRSQLLQRPDSGSPPAEELAQGPPPYRPTTPPASAHDFPASTSQRRHGNVLLLIAGVAAGVGLTIGLMVLLGVLSARGDEPWESVAPPTTTPPTTTPPTTTPPTTTPLPTGQQVAASAYLAAVGDSNQRTLEIDTRYSGGQPGSGFPASLWPSYCREQLEITSGFVGRLALADMPPQFLAARLTVLEAFRDMLIPLVACQTLTVTEQLRASILEKLKVAVDASDSFRRLVNLPVVPGEVY